MQNYSLQMFCMCVQLNACALHRQLIDYFSGSVECLILISEREEIREGLHSRTLQGNVGSGTAHGGLHLLANKKQELVTNLEFLNMQLCLKLELNLTVV